VGFLDKAAAKVSEATKAAQDGFADQQAKRKADSLLRELGAWTYAKHKGGFGEADENIARAPGPRVPGHFASNRPDRFDPRGLQRRRETEERRGHDSPEQQEQHHSPVGVRHCQTHVADSGRDAGHHGADDAPEHDA